MKAPLVLWAARKQWTKAPITVTSSRLEAIWTKRCVRPQLMMLAMTLQDLIHLSHQGPWLVLAVKMTPVPLVNVSFRLHGGGDRGGVEGECLSHPWPFHNSSNILLSVHNVRAAIKIPVSTSCGRDLLATTAAGPCCDRAYQCCLAGVDFGATDSFSLSDGVDMEEYDAEGELDDVLEGEAMYAADTLDPPDTETDEATEEGTPPVNQDQPGAQPAAHRRGSAAYFISKQHEKLYPGEHRGSQCYRANPAEKLEWLI